MYVLPSDGADEALDTNGTIARSVDSFQQWLIREGGVRLRVDTAGGLLDIGFARLTRTDAEIASSGVFVRDRIEAELRTLGFATPSKVYAVYYGGTSTHACGGGAWPPTLVGTVAALYLKGTPPGAAPCATNPFASSAASPGYLEFAMLHEVMHTIGLVATCAPHHTLSGHVSDDPTDLMYAGSQPWRPSRLDVGRDDYFMHARSGCLDVAQSSFVAR
jgi:hypothetical protein